MSSLPGYTLEAFLMWQYGLIVDGDGSANVSRQLAELLGTAPRPRQRLTAEQFAPVATLYAPYREEVERRLTDFDEDTQSWRDYTSYAFDFIPEGLYARSLALLLDAQLGTLAPVQKVVAGRDLDRRVATRLGFSVVELPPSTTVYNPDQNRWQYEQPGWVLQGDLLHKNLWGVRFKTQAEAWELCPGYSTEIESAFSLLDGLGFGLDYAISYGLEARTGYSLTIGGVTVCQFAETAPACICLGWLAWKEIAAEPPAPRSKEANRDHG